MKILHVGKYYYPYAGGIESHVQALAECAAESHTVSVAAASEGRRSSIDNIRGVTVRRAGQLCNISRAPFCPGMIAAIASTPADIVHLHIPNPGGVLAYLLSGHPGKLVVTEHDPVIGRPILKRLLLPFQQAVLNRASSIIVTSPNALESSELIRPYRDKCRVVPLGIDVSSATTPTEADIRCLRQRFKPPIALAVGRLVERKGFDHLIRAMAKVEGTLVIVGQGPMREELQSLIKSLNLADRVFLTGWVPDTAPYFAIADAFVLSSTHEGFGLVQLEAMLHELPVINTDLPTGVPFGSLHGVTGFTVPPADPASLASAIRCLWSSSEMRSRFGEAGRRRVLTEFTWEVMSRRTLSLYEEVISVGAARPLVHTRDLLSLACALSEPASAEVSESAGVQQT